GWGARTVWRPSGPGVLVWSPIASGSSWRAVSPACVPLVAMPATSKSSASIAETVSSIPRWSSTTSTRGARLPLDLVTRGSRRFTSHRILHTRAKLVWHRRLRRCWRLRLLGGIGFLVVSAACGGATPATSSPVAGSTRADVQLPGAGVTLGGVLVRPTASGPRPAIIVLHGFQPAGTNGASLVEPLAAEFASLGYVGLALSMRGWPPSGGVDDCGLRQPDDIAAALAWLAAQPGVDPDRLAVFGYSQGG